MAGTTIAVSIPLGQFHKELNQQLSRIDALLIGGVDKPGDPQIFREDLQRWSDFTLELLRSRFLEPRLPEEFEKQCRPLPFFSDDPIENLRAAYTAARMRRNVLQSIVDRRNFFQFKQQDTKARPELPFRGKDIFIVHGHREDLKHAVARLVTSVGLTPVILAEQPNEGQTLIEKFESNSNVAFAIVLLTGDDEGCAKGKPLQARARQNVILELVFCGFVKETKGVRYL